jgi:hypothetical protein
MFLSRLESAATGADVEFIDENGGKPGAACETPTRLNRKRNDVIL